MLFLLRLSQSSLNSTKPKHSLINLVIHMNYLLLGREQLTDLVHHEIIKYGVVWYSLYAQPINCLDALHYTLSE